ncbi:hypothetical protein JZ751_015694 [Albula glossodonta]|uniref:Uncharacterized protein n=1 Tax=Albula glossodonta TaxID=121402 RepID=A0A8T2MVH7_9TELE|nr:hypothetical protein JZ751_013870 [Albula glossodonta]KAG9342822.1 hypothetical protein JZ751_015694 [Albula glossodonta]
MAVPATVIYFTCYDQLCVALKSRMGRHSEVAPLIAGALARVGAATVISPLELIRTKMQSQNLSYGELRVCIQSSVRSEGIAAVATLPFDVVKTRRQVELGEQDALNRFLPRLVKVAPACAIMISTYEFGKAFFNKRNKERAVPTLQSSS